MKKLIISLTLSIFCLLTFAQTPQSFEYQAVVRDASSNILVNQVVGIQITLKQGSATGASVYQETFSTTTNLYGLVNLQIGTGSTGDDFTTINWANGSYFIEVALDVSGGTSYAIMGTSQLLSVPYALHAKTVEVDNVDDADNDPTNEIELPSSANVGDVLTWNGSNWIASPKNEGKTYLILSGDITDAEAVIKIANEVGPNTQFVTIQNTTNLTTVDLSNISELVDLTITKNVNLSSVNLSSLVNVYSNVSITFNQNLNTISLSSLTQASSSLVFTDNPIISSLSLPSLITSGNGFQVERCNNLNNLDISSFEKTAYLTINSTSISTLNFASLTEIGDINGATINITNNSNLTTINFPVFTSMVFSFNTTINIFSNSSLSSLNFPVLNAEIMQCVFTNNALTTVSHPNLTPASSYSIQNNNLPSSEINNLLNYFVNITPTLSGIGFQLQNQTPPAPPTGQGITDMNTLISNGNGVMTD